MKSITIVAASGAILTLPALAQKSPVRTEPLLRSAPAYFRDLTRAMGDRLSVPGKERQITTGTLVMEGKSDQVQVTFELPNLFRLDVLGSQPRTVAFDGAKSWGSSGQLTDADQDLVDTFLADSPEFFFYGVSGAGAYRVLGHRFRTDDGRDPAYRGPWYDIYELASPAAGATAQEKTFQQKMFYFDSETLLLHHVRYLTGGQPGGATVETVLADWHKVDGQYVPATIERLENGSKVVSFRSAAVTFAPRLDDGLFVQP